MEDTLKPGNYALEGSTPDSRLRSMMEEHGLRQRDLLDVFGSRGLASEVVSGNRAISKTQAKKLAGIFHVPAGLRPRATWRSTGINAVSSDSLVIISRPLALAVAL